MHLINTIRCMVFALWHSCVDAHILCAMLTYLLSPPHVRPDAKKTKMTSSMLYFHSTRSRSVFSRDGANEELIVPARSMPLSMAMVKNEHRFVFASSVMYRRER